MSQFLGSPKILSGMVSWFKILNLGIIFIVTVWDCNGSKEKKKELPEIEFDWNRGSIICKLPLANFFHLFWFIANFIDFSPNRSLWVTQCFSVLDIHNTSTVYNSTLRSYIRDGLYGQDYFNQNDHPVLHIDDCAKNDKYFVLICTILGSKGTLSTFERVNIKIL